MSLVREKTTIQSLSPATDVESKVTALKEHVIPELNRFKLIAYKFLKGTMTEKTKF